MSELSGNVQCIIRERSVKNSLRCFYVQDPVGSSPVMIHKRDLQKLVHTWHDMAVKMKKDPEADRAWG
jgi:hypothetical protein